MTSAPSSLLPTFRSALQSFAASQSTLRILRTIPDPPTSSSRSLPSHLLILDSSFNPPTKAHLHLAASAIRHQAAAAKKSPSSSSSLAAPKRLLLLLATHNANKPVQPAAFEHRLAMMTAFAHDLLDTLQQGNKYGAGNGMEQREEDVVIDICVTKHPYFIDKAVAIASSYKNTDRGSGVGGGSNTSNNDESPEQTHIIGYDTLLRILDPKYYPPSHTLAPLEPLFEKHKLLVAYRADDEWGSEEEQDAYLRWLKQEKEGDKGWRTEWADKMEMVKGSNRGGDVVSSTKAREVARQRDRKVLSSLCSDGVVDWILAKGLYKWMIKQAPKSPEVSEAKQKHRRKGFDTCTIWDYQGRRVPDEQNG